MSWLFAIIAVVAALVTWSLIAVRMINEVKEHAGRQSDQRDASLPNWVRSAPWPRKVIAPLTWWWAFRRPGSPWRGLEDRVLVISEDGPQQ